MSSSCACPGCRRTSSSFSHGRTASTELTVRVEARPDAASSDQRHRAAEELTALIKDNVGVTVDVDAVEPDAIERSAGKAVRLIDLR